MAQAQKDRALGASGLTVSPLGLGTNRWAYGKNDEQVLGVFQASLDAGLSLIDTAEVYGLGKSERLLGKCLRQTDRPVVVASKYFPLPAHPLSKALDASLSRLGLQTLDLYYAHFPLAPIDGLMDQMARAVQQGKIRAVGELSDEEFAAIDRASSPLKRKSS